MESEKGTCVHRFVCLHAISEHIVTRSFLSLTVFIQLFASFCMPFDADIAVFLAVHGVVLAFDILSVFSLFFFSPFQLSNACDE